MLQQSYLDQRLSQLYINGEWRECKSSKWLDVTNPCNESLIGKLALGQHNEIDDAVQAAQRAFPLYSKTSKIERIELLKCILSIYRKRVNEFAEAISYEIGAPITFSRTSQAQAGIDHLEALIADLERYQFKTTLNNGNTVLMEPVGVCGLITPWNWPINQIVLKVGPALAAGCTMILKPSELTPISAILFTEVLNQAGVPPGVFNLVQGEGSVAGAALSKHPDVSMISFTGSTRAGHSIYQNCAERIAKVTLELGGKSANILFDDCVIDKSVHRGIEACFINSGQSCDAASRMLVEKSIYRQVIDQARIKCENFSLGKTTISGENLGPLINKVQFDRVQHLIAIGIEEGATLICGGLGKPKGFERGYYVKPTIFADVRNDMKIAQEEIFGPVLCIIPFETEQEAINIANDSPYGLAAYVQTSDSDRALRVARSIRCGSININGEFLSAGSPFGGYKLSGLGREGGLEGLKDFLEIKSIATPYMF